MVVGWKQFENAGRGMFTVGRKYQRIGEGQHT
jgi:hypothetical protein